MADDFRITDHAILRYMERALKLDLSRIRQEIESKVKLAAAAGAKRVTVDGLTFCLSAGGTCVTTVLDADMTRPGKGRSPSMRGNHNKASHAAEYQAMKWSPPRAGEE